MARRFTVIDSHTHIIGESEDPEGAVQRYFASLDDNGIEKAVLVAVDGICSNEFVKDVYLTSPDRIIIYYNWKPRGHEFEDGFQGEERSYFSGIKIHPRLHNFSLTDPNVCQLFDESVMTHSEPILLDCWFSEEDDYRQVDDVVQFVRTHPNQNIILAHCGGFRYRDILSLAKFEHIYVDTSYILHVFCKFKRTELIHDFMSRLRQVPIQKILFGSDYPTCSIDNSLALLEKYLEEYGFSSSEVAEIFYNNISRLLKLNR